MAKCEKAGKMIFVLCLAAVLALAGAAPAGASFNHLLRDVPRLTWESEIFLLISLDDGSVIFSHNERQRTAPASLAKIVTVILVLEHAEDLNEVVAARAEHINYFHGMNAAHMSTRVGEELTVEQLLYGLMLQSANEAARILAEHIAGSVEAFVDMMNEFVQRIGATDSYFTNPHGLDRPGAPSHTTAADIALITRYALHRDFRGNALFERMAGSLRFEIPETNNGPRRNLLNTNRMINRYHPQYFSPHVSGVKTGFTNEAGHNIVAMASRGGFRYLAVVMRGQRIALTPDGPLRNTAKTDARALLDWAFANIRMQQVTETDRAVAEIPVDMARNTDRVQLVPSEALFAFVPEGVHSGNVLIEPIPGEMPERITAPVSRGDHVGRARVMFAGTEFAQVDLVAADDVSRSASMYMVELARRAVRTTIARMLLLAVLFVAGVYLAVVVIQQRRRRREKQLRVVPDITKKDQGLGGRRR